VSPLAIGVIEDHTKAYSHGFFFVHVLMLCFDGLALALLVFLNTFDYYNKKLLNNEKKETNMREVELQ